ncbi:MAG: hypothetical protein ACAH59_07665 [Pseudobdellovibrionaceae bacterium]
MKKGDGDPIARELQLARLEDLNRRAAETKEKAAHEKTPEGRIAKLTGDKVKRFDEAKMGLAAVNGMAAALDSGNNTFSPVGDNDFTRNSSLFEEAIGRMQSGGAIGVEEAKRFKALRPTMWDSPEQQRAKLVNLQNEFAGRIQTLGFQPEELGLSKAEFKYGESKTKQPGGGVNPVLAGGGLKQAVDSMKSGQPDFSNMTNEQLKKYIGK